MNRVVLLPADNRAAVAIPLRDGTYAVGRAIDSDIVMNDRSVSRRHARLTVNGTLLTVTDLGSRNGTFVDDCQVQSSPVRIGQALRFGHAPYRLSVESNSSFLSLNDDDETVRRSQDGASTERDLLTPAQRRVYELMLQGRPEAEIAAFLDLSIHTIHTHAKAIYSRFGVHSRGELLARRIIVTRKNP